MVAKLQKEQKELFAEKKEIEKIPQESLIINLDIIYLDIYKLYKKNLVV